LNTFTNRYIITTINVYIQLFGFHPSYLDRDKVSKFWGTWHLQASISGKKCIITSKLSSVTTPNINSIDHSFIQENISKCETKIIEGDYSGAITNARSLIESVLLFLDKELTNEEIKFDGDLNGLYKRVAKNLNLSIEKDTNIEKSLKKVISGLFSINSGFAEISNMLSDRHGKNQRSYKPESHHSVLAVNSSKVFCEFLLSSFEFQKTRTTWKH